MPRKNQEKKPFFGTLGTDRRLPKNLSKLSPLGYRGSPNPSEVNKSQGLTQQKNPLPKISSAYPYLQQAIRHENLGLLEGLSPTQARRQAEEEKRRLKQQALQDKKTDQRPPNDDDDEDNEGIVVLKTNSSHA